MTLEEAKKIRFCNGRGYSTIEFIQALQLTEEIKNNNTMTQEDKIKVVDINYAELYGVKPNESDFSGAIGRSLKNGISHLSKEYLQCIMNINKH